MAAPIVTFLTDYGLADDFVGVCHGVIAQGCPQARVIDLTHGIGAQDIRAGALTLARALPYLPVGVHLAVVDPGVGGPRRAIAAATGDGRHFVGPDNGLLWPALRAAGGACRAVDVGRSPHVREPLSATFHGRDVFAPVAAVLAAGAPLDDVGAPIDPASIVPLELPRPALDGSGLVVHVLSIDGFGNLALDAGPRELDAAGIGGRARLTLDDGRTIELAVGRRFGDVGDGEPLLYVDAYAQAAIAVNGASAARWLPAGIDARMRIAPAGADRR